MPASNLISFELDTNHAVALAQFAKRISRDEVRQHAESDHEAREMMHALSVLRASLCDLSFGVDR